MTYGPDNIIYDEWLSEILQRDVYKVIVTEELIEQVKDKTCEEYTFFRKLQSQNIFMYAKVATNFIRGIHFLEALGFNLIDTNIVFTKPIASSNKFFGNCTLRAANTTDKDSVVRVARNSFRCSRFHLDPQIPEQVSNDIKAKWVENFFAGKRADEMVVALVDGEIAGFVTLIHRNEEELVIDLIAVEEKHRKKGIASDIISYAESHSNRRRMTVGTQVANLTSTCFYEKSGFRLCESYYVFHYHNFPKDIQ